MFEANRDYNVTVIGAYFMQSSAKGTWGHELTYEDANGETLTDVIWLTPKTLESVRKSYTAMGLTDEQIANPDFIKNPQDYVVGKQCSIRTYADTYKDKTRIKVQWINPVHKEAEGNPVSAAADIASMFAKRSVKAAGDKPAPKPKPVQKTEPAMLSIEPDDVPF
jgi:hypothetical protein